MWLFIRILFLYSRLCKCHFLNPTYSGGFRNRCALGTAVVSPSWSGFPSTSCGFTPVPFLSSGGKLQTSDDISRLSRLFRSKLVPFVPTTVYGCGSFLANNLFVRSCLRRTLSSFYTLERAARFFASAYFFIFAF